MIRLRKKTTTELSSDGLFQTLFQTSSDAALVTRVRDAVILHVNEGFCRVTRYQPQEVVGKTTLELGLYDQPSDREMFLSIIGGAGILEERSAFFRRRDGSRFSALISARSFWSNGNEYVCASIRDISEQQRIEREQRERDEELRRLFETMSQAVIYQDIEGNLISSNPGAERLLGLSALELSQRSSDSPEWRTLREDGSYMLSGEHPSMVALRTGKPVGPMVVGVYNASLGDHVWLSVNATPLFRAGEDKPYQVYVMMEDITATRRAQRDFQQLFCEMVDASALHQIICDESGKPIDYVFLAVNPAFERMTGVSAQELVGKRILEVLPGTEQYWIETYGQVALTGQPAKFQNYSAELDKYFNVTAYRPAPMQFACTFTDITTEIRLQQDKDTAQKTIKQLAHICDVAPSSILVFNNEGKILYANEYTSQLHNLSKEELQNRYLYEFSDENGAHTFGKKLEQIRAEGEAVLTQDIYRSDGTPIPMLIFSKRCEWEGKPAILAIGTDLTEQIKAEKDLQRSLGQTQRILDSLQDGFFQAKLDGAFIRINPRMAQIYGYDSVADMMQANAKSMYVDLFDRAAMFEILEREGHVTSYVCMGQRKDGSQIWVSMHVQHLRDESGEIIGTEGLIRDTTERRKLEQEIEKQHESLQKSNEVLKKRLEQSINAISKVVELRDVYTAGHQKRVMQLACAIGARLNLSHEEITNLSYGALIHDIGKIYIASDILNKPGKITNLEYQILQTHAEYSYNIAQEMDLPEVILTMVLQHHERLDGTGYPNRIQDGEIILESRILAVADVVEAMTTHRPYRAALGIDLALAEIEAGKGVKFDASVVDHCVALFREEGFSFSIDA